MIPCGKPDTGPLERQYLLEAIESNEISKGKALSRFEEKLCEWTHHDHAVGVSSGTDALVLALKAHGIGDGDEVIVPTLTFAAVAAAVIHAGAEPVFVGSIHDSCIDPSAVAMAMSDDTAAVIAVHSYGNRADVLGVQRAAGPGMPIIVDASQGHGLVTIGDYTEILSFHGNKVVTCGEGGAVVTDDDAIADYVRYLATHAQDNLQSFWHTGIGHNCKLTNLQAAVGLAQLDRWEEIEANRLRVARRYEQNLRGSIDIDIHPYDTPWLVSVMVDDRDAVSKALTRAEIEHRAWFPLIHTMPPYIRYDYVDSGDDTAQALSDDGLSLPTFGQMKNDQIDRVCDVVLSCV